MAIIKYLASFKIILIDIQLYVIILLQINTLENGYDETSY